MKKTINSCACICLAAMLTLLAACSGNGGEDITTSTAQVHDYIYSGTVQESQESSASETGSNASDISSLGSAIGILPPGDTEVKPDGDKNTLPAVPDTKLFQYITPEEPPKKSVSVTVPEGATMAEIFAILDSKGVASFNSLMNTAVNVDFTYYPLINAQKKTGRAFRLEGYLCAGTYTFYENSKPEDAIGKLLRTMESRVNVSMRRQAAQQGYTVDDIITIASVIQKESLSKSDMQLVSAVIHNRLKQGMMLEMNSTVAYVDSSVKPYIQSVEQINQYNDYYDTFSCAGLPAGPICSVGQDALKAALNPANVSYLYFCVDGDGNYYYADTQQEHEQNKIKAGLLVQP